MKRSFLAIALLACASLASAAYAAVAPMVIAVVGFAQRLKDLVIDGIALVARAVADVNRPAVVLVQAKAFVQRLAKRERPVVTSTWRMCPSI
jgi:hypothetical protein